MDVLRQERMRVLAAESDARWAEKPSFLVAPVPAPAAAQKGGGAGSKVVGDGEGEGPVTGRSSDLDKASRAYNVAGEKGQRESPKVVVTQQDLRGHEGHQTSPTPETSAKSEPKKSPWAASSKTRDEPQPWNPKAVRRR
jgi:NADH dehydrogenase [ubiquinone] 1 alpha subcomplex assembly factor 2